MPQRKVGQIEIDPLGQQVGRADHRLPFARRHGGRIVPASQERGFVLRLHIRHQPVDQAEFAQLGDLRPSVFLLHIS